MINRAILAFIVAAVLAAVVWALSGTITGHSEPWDSEGPYYVIGLALAGAVSGAIFPRYLISQYLGAVSGQAIFEIVFLGVGPLFVLGLVFLLGYSVVFVATAALVAFIRTKKAKSVP